MRCERNQVPKHRRGSVYVLVMITAAFVVIAGLSSAVLQRMALQSDVILNEQREARVMAMSGAEYAVSRAQWFITQNGATWRQALGPVYTSNQIAMGQGHFIWKAEDASGDGDITDDPLDPILVTSKGVVGNAAFAMSLIMDPVEGTDPLDCIQHQVHVGGHTQISAQLRGAGLIRSNGTVDASADVNLGVEAVGAITGGPYHGSTVTLADPFLLPASDTISRYASLATPIDISDLPFAWGKREFKNVLLSPGSNPFGAGQTNPNGVYILDCEWQTLEIENVRIVGTLILRNVNAWCRVAGNVCWEPAVTGFPALLVDGSFELRVDSTHQLQEPTGVSLNPDHTPSQGASDSDDQDAFPSAIKGIVYVTGNLNIENELLLEGPLIVGGRLDVNKALTMVDNDASRLDPPMGFRGWSDAMAPRVGSIERVVE